MPLTLILGGVRAGKSSRALELAGARGASARMLFVATAQAFDDEMRRRIETHKNERPPHWETLESPIEVAADIEGRLREGSAPYDAIVVDCLTVWMSNVLLSLGDAEADAEGAAAARIEELVALTRPGTLGAGARWVLVSNEVGLGVVPPTALGRRYRDMLGRANQVAAAAADRVLLMVAGLEVCLKPSLTGAQVGAER